MFRFLAPTSLIILIYFLCITPSYCQVEKENAIDIAYKKCILKDTSTSNIGVCAFEAYSKWNLELEKEYKKILKIFNKDNDKIAFKNAQTAWATFRDTEFACYDNMFNKPGKKYWLLRAQSRIDLVRNRTNQLKNYRMALQK